MRAIILRFETIYRWGFWFFGMPILAITVIETLNALGRKLHWPFPMALETVECLMVVCTYWGVAAVAQEGGHVNVILMTRTLAQPAQDFLDGLANLFATAIFGIWAGATSVHAVRSASILEKRIGVYHFPIWPFKILFAVGLVLLTIQLFFNAVKCFAAARGRPIVEVRQEQKALG